VMSTGRAQMSSAGNVRDWCAAVDQVLGGLVVQTSVHCYSQLVVDAFWDGRVRGRLHGRVHACVAQAGGHFE